MKFFIYLLIWKHNTIITGAIIIIVIIIIKMVYTDIHAGNKTSNIYGDNLTATIIRIIVTIIIHVQVFGSC